MIKPLKLFPGATLGIICPSYQIDSLLYKKAIKIFIERGFKIIEGKTLSLKNNLYAGSPEERANDIMEMFKNPEVDAIICARGGYGANRVLPLLDFNIIGKNPKIFVGFSDITALLLSITQYNDIITFHGPMISSYKDGFVEYNFNNFINILSGNSRIKITAPSDQMVRVLKSGKATGELWGGNLCLLVNRIGTREQLKTDNAILFIEDVDEQYYRFDRMMYHLKQAGTFNKIKGLIVGEMKNMQDTDPPFGRTTDQIVMDICGDLDIPIISNFPCGHGKYQVTLPLSLPVQLDASSQSPSVTILESSVL